jgi:predicted DNA-binding protein
MDNSLDDTLTFRISRSQKEKLMNIAESTNTTTAKVVRFCIYEVLKDIRNFSDTYQLIGEFKRIEGEL